MEYRGFFIYVDKGRYIAVNKTTGEHETEAFSLKEVKNYIDILLDEMLYFE